MGLAWVGFFCVVSGVTNGVTIAIELNRAAQGLGHYSPSWEGWFSAIRGIAFGACLWRSLGLGFAAAFAVLLTLGQIVAYSRGIRPAMDYAATGRPRITRRHAWAILVRTVGYTATALLCSALVRHVDHAWAFAIRVGLVIGVVSGIGNAVVPLIEYFADNLPERRLGVFGIALILCGFGLQSFQYWVVVLDVRVT